MIQGLVHTDPNCAPAALEPMHWPSPVLVSGTSRPLHGAWEKFCHHLRIPLKPARTPGSAAFAATARASPTLSTSMPVTTPS